MVNITRLFEFPYYQLEKKNIADCLVTKYDGVWTKTSTQEYIDKAKTFVKQLDKNDKYQTHKKYYLEGLYID